jgi:hypothetical protein
MAERERGGWESSARIGVDEEHDVGRGVAGTLVRAKARAPKGMRQITYGTVGASQRIETSG